MTLPDLLEPSAPNLATRIGPILSARPDLRARFHKARRILRTARHGRTVELTNRCNLFCEGCLFFEGDQSALTREEDDIENWRNLFARFKAEGVRHLNIAGAEPALQTERLQLAAEYIPHGLIVTNGTIRIPKDIPYAIHVSVWGDREMTETLRGGKHLERSIRNFRDDPRVHFIYTVSKQNIDQIEPVVRLMQDEGCRISFNLFSPTESYLEKISTGQQNDNRFFRLSNERSNLILDGNDLDRIREILDRLISAFPETVIFLRAYNQLLTARKSIYELDETTGFAGNCGGSNASPWYQLYGTDGRKSQSKCCTPNISCETCRLYTPALATLMFRVEEATQSEASFENWLDICEYWGSLMMMPEVQSPPE